MGELTRRSFLKEISYSTPGLALLLSPTAISFGNGTQISPQIEVLDPRYKFEIISSNLPAPEGIAVTSDNRIFFVQKMERNFHGIYELVNGTPKYRFPGSRGSLDDFADETEIFINNTIELLVYTSTNKHDSLTIYDLEKGTQILNIAGPRSQHKGYKESSIIKVDSKNKELYLLKYGPIPNPVGFSYSNWSKTYIFDRGKREFVPVDEESSPFKDNSTPKLIGVQEQEEEANPKDYWSFRDNRHISDKAGFITGILYQGYKKGDIRLKELKGKFPVTPFIKALPGRECIYYSVVYSFDTKKDEAKPILVVRDLELSLYDSVLDTNGNLYCSISPFIPLLLNYKNLGNIIKISKK